MSMVGGWLAWRFGGGAQPHIASHSRRAAPEPPWAGIGLRASSTWSPFPAMREVPAPADPLTAEPGRPPLQRGGQRQQAHGVADRG
jgi:hypothetical protein